MARNKTRLLNIDTGSLITIDNTRISFTAGRNSNANNIPGKYDIAESDDLGVSNVRFQLSSAFDMNTGSAIGDKSDMTLNNLYPFINTSGLKFLSSDLITEVFGNFSNIYTTGSDSSSTFYSGCKIIISGFTPSFGANNDVATYNITGIVQPASVT